MKSIVFDSYEAARAAFELGPVVFRCRQCKKMHNSSKAGYVSCVKVFESILKDLFKAEGFPEVAHKAHELFPDLPLWNVIISPGKAVEYYRNRSKLAELAMVSGPFYDYGKEEFLALLSLSDEGFKDIALREVALFEERKKNHIAAVGQQAESLAVVCSELLKELTVVDPSVFPVQLLIIRGPYGEIDKIYGIQFGGREVTFAEPVGVTFRSWWHLSSVPDGDDAELVVLRHALGNLAADLLRRFKQFKNPYSGLEGRQFVALNYSLYDVCFKPEGVYFTLQERQTTIDTKKDYTSTSRTYHVLFLKDYSEPVDLGTVRDKRIAADIEKALKKVANL